MQITNILLPVDGSNYSDHATDYAIYLAKLSKARITAVSCYDSPTHLSEVSDTAVAELKIKAERVTSDILEKTGLRIKKAGVDCMVKPIPGAPGKNLTDLAKSKEFDVIIMGSEGHSDIAGILLGSVSHEVLNTIYCPVLVVP